jgi:hypothetical protein
MAKTLRRMCYVCQSRPAKLLKPKKPYTHAYAEPGFCSVRCAADYGLLLAGAPIPSDLNWCDTHGWYNGWDTYEGCPNCETGGTEGT